LLTNDGLANHSGLAEQVVSWLEDSLKVGRIPLCEWELLAQPVQGYPPCEDVAGPRQLDEAVEAPRNRRGKREVPADG
jgi:hypothetical protein